MSEAANSSRITVGEWERRNQGQKRRQIITRLINTTEIKLELENKNEKLRRKLKRCTNRISELEQACRNSPNQLRAQVAKCENRVYLAKLHNDEMRERLAEVQSDYDRIYSTVGKFRPEMRCAKCNKTKRIECFAKDVTKLLGRDTRCKLCIREKTQRWRMIRPLKIHS